MTKSVGSAVFWLGLIAVIFCLFFMDATVGEYYNIGLINQKSNFVTVSCFATLIGAIWMVLGDDPEAAKQTENNATFDKQEENTLETHEQ